MIDVPWRPGDLLTTSRTFFEESLCPDWHLKEGDREAFSLVEDELFMLIAVTWNDDLPVMVLLCMRKRCVLEHSHVRFFKKSFIALIRKSQRGLRFMHGLFRLCRSHL